MRKRIAGSESDVPRPSLVSGLATLGAGAAEGIVGKILLLLLIVSINDPGHKVATHNVRTSKVNGLNAGYAIQ